MLGRKTVTVTVANSGDRPIQVGSHYHFFETNPALKFERKKTRGNAARYRRRNRGAFRAGADARGHAGSRSPASERSTVSAAM